MVAAPDPDIPALELRGIEKGFPGVRALKGVSFACRRGEIHALVGENGAGKSTLMRVIAGMWPPDAGTILVGGREVWLSSPRLAHDLGIAMVFQDTRLVPDLDVARNIWLGREPGRLLLDRSAMEAGARRILDRLGVNVPLRRDVRELGVAERQLVEIARALTTDPAVLILDEPTSALDAAEIERLFAIVRDVKRAGTSVIFISHRLPEVFAIADRITVLRDGEVVGTVARDAIDADGLVAMMVGRALSTAYPPRASRMGQPRLSVRGLSSPGRFAEVGFTVHAGEIVGLGGIQGNGQAEVASALFGLLPQTGAIDIDGQPVALDRPSTAIRAGLVYVPGDRHREGLFMPRSIRENVSLPHLWSWAGLGLVPAGRERAATRDAIERFAVRTPSGEQPVSALSGGNQQKVVLGRWTTGAPRVFIFEDPTRGVDVAAKLDIYRRIRALTEGGAAVLLVASDLMELIGLSDRILVFSRGRVIDEVAGADATEERIVGSAVEARAAAVIASSAGLMKDTKARRDGGRDRPLLHRYGSTLLLFALVLLLGTAASARSSYFLTGANLSNLASQIAPLALVALGQLTVILLGGVDLSVGPLISLVTGIVSFVAVGETEGSTLAAIVASLGAGLVVGALNAILILRLRIPDLIATLSTYSMVLGLALTVRPSPGGAVSDAFLDTVTATVGPVSWAVVGVVALALMFELLLARGRLGQRLYGTGSSPEASYGVGIRIGVVRAGAYLFCALTAAAAGVLIAARIGSGDPQAGSAFTLASITAVVIGGASVFGGRGTALGTLVGAIAVGLMQNALNLMQVSAYYQYIWAGALTLVAVVGYALRLPGRKP